MEKQNLHIRSSLVQAFQRKSSSSPLPKSLHVDGVLICLNRNARTTLLPKERFPLARNTPPSLISPLETLRLATVTQSPSRPFSLSFTSKARPLHRQVGTPCPQPVIPYLTDSISCPLQRPCSCAENQPCIRKSPIAIPLLQPCQRLSLESPRTALITAGAPGTPSLHTFPARMPCSPPPLSPPLAQTSALSQWFPVPVSRHFRHLHYK